eukprot:c40812_g1_i1 orf=217-387(+)
MPESDAAAGDDGFVDSNDQSSVKGHPWMEKMTFWLSEASIVGVAAGYCLAASLLSI